MLARFFSLAFLLTSTFASTAWSESTGRQAVFSSERSRSLNQSAPNVELFTPLKSFSALSEERFIAFGHPLFPQYNVRIKKSRFCDSTVQTYTGYIDIQARHLFFYFFESRNDPAKDDIIFWTNGGPGGSSALGLFMELGPCRILDEGGPKFHPDSWNSNANIFFIDQPIGTGFSYADFGETISTTEEAAQDIAAFLAIFFENFSQFKGRKFHLAGESYAGRFLPLFAAAIHDQNPKLVEGGMATINLQSIMMGNAMVDAVTFMLSYPEMGCTHAAIAPILDVQTCVGMKLASQRCEKWLLAACRESYDAINCGAAWKFCEGVALHFKATGLNPYDVSKKCDADETGGLCYPFIKHFVNYLSQPSVQAMLGVDPAKQGNFSNIALSVQAAFTSTQDMLQPTTPHYIAALLERGIRVLVYIGTYDWLCNHVGGERWTSALEWTGQKEFNEQPLRDWFVDPQGQGKRAGWTRSAKGFTYATIEAAGHMAPYDKPKESLTLIQRWLANEDL